MNWKRASLRLGLISMIFLSFYLTYLIWLNPSNKRGIDRVSTEDGFESTVVAKDEVNPRRIEDIFLPLELIEVTDSQARETVSESAIKQVVSLIGKSKIDQTQFMEYKTDKEFVENTQLQNGVELNYLNELSLNDTIAIHDLNFHLSNEVKSHPVSYDRVQFDFAKSEMILLNTEKKLKLTATISENADKFKAVLKDSKIVWCPVTYEPNYLMNQYVSTNPINMKMYSYISSVQPYTIFRDSFFQSENHSQNSDDRSNLLIMNQSEMMTVQMKDRLIDYRDTNLPKSEMNIYSKSFDYIRNLGNNYGNLRFVNQTNTTMNYRVFVEGYPIFSDGNEGMISLQFTDNPQSSSRSLRIQANMNTIQVPIPSDQTVELPSSKNILDQLVANSGSLSKVSGVMIGYKWSDVKDTEVVDLLPTWFINYEGKWTSTDRLFSKLVGREDN